MNFLKQLLPFKYKRSVKDKLGVPSLHWSLQNLKKKHFYPEYVVDIGAYEGNWAKDFAEVFPEAKILMVEAQGSKATTLQRAVSENKNVEYVISLLSSEDNGVRFFAENETASQVMHGKEEGGNYKELRSLTLDTLLAEKKFPFPDFLKLDVQGHELEVLKGAQRSLAAATICLLEISLLDLGDNNPLMLEMLNYMDKQGYQAYDISQFIRRPFDKALYQIDMFFVKKDAALISDKVW